MDFCLKSCLSVTCGCGDAPGFDTLDKLYRHTKANDALGGPVKDTPPSTQYRKATLAECGKGVYGAKITSGLFVNYGTGWNEICTEAFMTNTLPAGTDTAPSLKRCASTADTDYDYGCKWDNDSGHGGECVVGFMKMGKCMIKYTDDKEAKDLPGFR